MTRVFVKDDSNPYCTRYTECPIEETGDEFFTSTEVEEATDCGFAAGVRNHFHYPAMKRALAKAAKTVPTDKKSVVLDSDLLWAIKDEWEITAYLDDKRWRVNNGRLYVGPPEQKAVRVSDFKYLKSTACSLLRGKGVSLQFIHDSKKDEVIRVIKKLVTWKEVAADLADDYYYKRDNHEIKWMRKLWLDPTLMEGK